MFTPTLFLLGLGFGAAIMLVVASKVFYVWEDPKIQEVEESLLGANCGGCGYPGCSAAAAAVVAGKAGANVCVAGGSEIALKVAAVMGIEVEVSEPEIAYSSCRYNLEDADTKYVYSGVPDCRAAAAYGGGPKECPIGCIGLGTCYRSCPFGAISMSEYGLPVFDRDRCRGCGICVEVCPKDIIYLSSTTARMTGDFRTDECTTPCQRACPTGVDIPGYVRQITMGNFEEAVRIVKERCPLPLIVGRICPAPCEMDCRRALVDRSVGINTLKRFVADHEMKSGKRIHPLRAAGTGKRVAVIGGGAQGLTTAYYLACLGHEPTIYESTGRLGGIVRYVIPPARLPEKVLDWEIQGILDAGVKAETEKTAGRDFTIASLLGEGFRAVALATGGLDGRSIMPGGGEVFRAVPGVFLLVDFLSVISKRDDFRTGGTVYIFGGGTSAVEAARACLRGGARQTVIISPSGRQEMIDRGIDLDGAEREGMRFLFSTVICGLSGRDESLSGLRLIREDCTAEDVPADMLILSTGRVSDLVFAGSAGGNDDPGSWKTLDSYRMNPDNRYDDIFGLKELGVLNDNLAVVRSIARGRRIARSIHLYLGGKEQDPPVNQIRKGMKILNTKDIRGVEPARRNLSSPGIPAGSYSDPDVLFGETEIDAGLTEEMALNEAGRCLDCGLICYRKSGSSDPRGPKDHTS
ncbi:MAG: FAD-dependent oxidoreductase [Spirochaetes bacterium]|nr:FAD-dependent oxidoreductase [Spirochaetota bacterium]